MATSADRADEADPREDVHAPPATSNGSTSCWRFRTLKHVSRTFRAVPVSAPCPKHCEADRPRRRSEEHTSELQSLMRSSYAVFCLKKKNTRPVPTSSRTRTYS